MVLGGARWSLPTGFRLVGLDALAADSNDGVLMASSARDDYTGVVCNAIVSEEAVQLLWPCEDPLGKRFAVLSEPPTGTLSWELSPMYQVFTMEELAARSMARLDLPTFAAMAALMLISPLTASYISA